MSKLLRSIFALLVVFLVAGCVATVEETNGPVGDAKVTLGPPWRVRASDRATSTTKTEPCGASSTEEECEGGTCRIRRR